MRTMKAVVFQGKDHIAVEEVPRDEALHAGLGDQKIVTTLCPGGKERMRRLMAMIANRRVDISPLVTHRFSLDDIHDAFDLFSHQSDGVLKVALYPTPVASRHQQGSEASVVSSQ